MLAIASGAAVLETATRPFPTHMARARIGGEVFHLEIAKDDRAQERGLAGRARIDSRSGMLFVFPTPQWQEFVMRDCTIAIDLLFLDEHGRIIALHEMAPEPPRSQDERPGDPMRELVYLARLTPYSSGQPASAAIEVRAGTISRLGLEAGDEVFIDADLMRMK